MRQLESKIFKVLEQHIAKIGYELIGCEYIAQGSNSILRIYVDSDMGVSLDDCQKVIDYVDPLLDVEDIVQGKYNLEVSSPGENRPLFTHAQFAKYTGEIVHVRLKHALDGRRNFKGKLVSVDEKNIEVEIDSKLFNITFDSIDKANLVFVPSD